MLQPELQERLGGDKKASDRFLEIEFVLMGDWEERIRNL
jgi:hypothetical protein